MRFNRLLFVTLMLSTLILGTNMTHGKTWTVDDDLQEYPEADFTIIQKALNAAEDGDTVLVHDGTYRESLISSKSISLISNNGPNNTIVAPEDDGYMLQISMHDSVVNGFTIMGDRSYEKSYPITIQGTQNSIIENNVITGEKIRLGGLNNNTISNNIFNTTELSLGDVSFNIITENTILSYRDDFFQLSYTDDNHDNKFYLNNIYSSTFSVHIGEGFHQENYHYSTASISYVYDENEYESILGNYWIRSEDVLDYDNNGVIDDPQLIGQDMELPFCLVGPYIDGVIQSMNNTISGPVDSSDDHDVTAPSDTENVDTGDTENQTEPVPETPIESDSEPDSTPTTSVTDTPDTVVEESDDSQGIPSFSYESILLGLIILGFYLRTQNPA